MKISENIERNELQDEETNLVAKYSQTLGVVKQRKRKHPRSNTSLGADTAYRVLYAFLVLTSKIMEDVTTGF